MQGAPSSSPLPRSYPYASISFSSQSLESRAASFVLELSCSDPLLLLHLQPITSPSFKNLSTYYPYLFLPLLLSSDRASKPSQQVLVTPARYSSSVTPSLSPSCPSTTLTTLLSLSVKPYMSQNGLFKPHQRSAYKSMYNTYSGF